MLKWAYTNYLFHLHNGGFQHKVVNIQHSTIYIHIDIVYFICFRHSHCYPLNILYYYRKESLISPFWCFKSVLMQYYLNILYLL
jgi:hypothetical protein